MRYSYGVLLVFVLLEVLLFGASSSVQAVVAVAEYGFVAFVLVRDIRAGLMYFISFTLLAMAGWSHVLAESAPGNFWGLRVFGVSVNILLTAVIAALCLLSPSLKTKSPASGLTINFLMAFVAYSLLVGLIAVALSVNYVDNFLADTLVYLPLFVYVYLVSRLETDAVLRMATYGVSLTVVSMVLSQLTGNMFQYAEGAHFRFVLMNSFAFVVVFGVFFMRSMYSKGHYYFLVLAVVLLLTIGDVFVGGKTIVCLVAAALWGMLKSKRVLLVTSVAGLLLALFLEPIVSLVAVSTPDVSLTGYKLTQIYDLFDFVDIEALSALPTSMGNIVAEARTIFTYLSQNKLALLLGKGFGAGIPDLFGHLAPMAGPGSAYADQDVLRNDFVRMHLPLFEIVLKSGIVGLSLYLFVLMQNFRSKSVFAFVSFVLLATVFTNSKEMLLLSLVFITLATNLASDRGSTTQPVAAFKSGAAPQPAG